ncbi:MAG: RNA methyltransferase [Tissierellaceae bacterium]
MQIISSVKNPLIKNIKSLHRKKERLKNSSFVIEGIKIIEEAIESNYPIKNIVYTDQLLKVKDGENLFNKIREFHNLIYVTDNVFKEISDTENPQGVLAVAEIRQMEINQLNFNKMLFLLYLDQLQDPGNMGTVIRTADAFNVDCIIIGQGSVDPYNPKVVRATMGSIFRVPLVYETKGYGELKYLKEKGIHLYATSLEGSKLIYEVDYKSCFILAIGNESNGISEKIISMSNGLIKIPMPGKAESLNAGIAASIIMYEVMKQRS